MSLNTYPYNPFPASTDKLDEAHNAELQQEVDQLKSGLTNVNSNLGGLHLISFMMTDIFLANSDTSNGVLLSDLTGGAITTRDQVKGLAPFNTQANVINVLQYQNKLVLKTDVTSSTDRTITIPMVLFY